MVEGEDVRNLHSFAQCRHLAAKLIAPEPSLTPVQVIELIKKGATASDNGRLHLIDAKASVALLKSGKIVVLKIRRIIS